MEINLGDSSWERVRGFISEHDIDARWKLIVDGRTYGSLRIVSHPDLPPGQLRAIFTYITKSIDKSDEDKLRTIEDYKIEIEELEVFSIDQNIETSTEIIEDYKNKLEEMFNVKIFE